jgi:hypothetical protein
MLLRQLSIAFNPGRNAGHCLVKKSDIKCNAARVFDIDDNHPRIALPVFAPLS